MTEATIALADGRVDRSRWERGTSRADGSYELDVDATNRPWLRIEASADGCITRLIDAPLPADLRQPLELDVVLARGVELSGRVTWSDGQPCADAAIALELPQKDHRWLPSEAQLAATRTDEHGNFRATLGGGQIVRVDVQVGTWKPVAPTLVIVPDSGTRDVAIVLPRPAKLHVHVTGGEDDLFAARGKGAPRLSLFRPDEPRSGVRAQIVDGRDFEFSEVDPAPAWHLGLALPSGGVATLARDLRLPPGEHTDLDVTLDDEVLARLREPGLPSTAVSMRFRWRLTDEEGTVLDASEFSRRSRLTLAGEVPVRARSLVDSALGIASLESMGASAMHGAGFVAAVRPPVELEFRIGSEVVRRGPVADGDEVELVVPQPPEAGRLVVRFTDARGSPRAPVNLWILSLDTGETRVVLGDARRDSTTVLLPPGEHIVSADHPREEAIPRRVRLAAGEESTIGLALGDTGLVRGLLRPAPDPGTSVTVQAHAADGSGYGLVRQAAADLDGAFELAGLAAGEWVLVALAAGPGEVPAPTVQPVRVREGQATDLVFALHRAPGRDVLVRRGAGAAGFVRLEGLDSALQVVWLLAPGDERRLVLPVGRYRCLTTIDSMEGWPLQDSPRPVEFSIAREDPTDALILDA